jgi:hypothetical protein
MNFYLQRFNSLAMGVDEVALARDPTAVAPYFCRFWPASLSCY